MQAPAAGGSSAAAAAPQGTAAAQPQPVIPGVAPAHALVGARVGSERPAQRLEPSQLVPVEEGIRGADVGRWDKECRRDIELGEQRSGVREDGAVRVVERDRESSERAVRAIGVAGQRHDRSAAQVIP